MFVGDYRWSCVLYPEYRELLRYGDITVYDKRFHSICSIYNWKLYLFYGERLLHFRKGFTSFIFRPTYPCFSPLQVLAAKLLC